MDVPIMPMATNSQGAFLPARKKEELSVFFAVTREMPINIMK
jgi:hypothetical protein